MMPAAAGTAADHAPGIRLRHGLLGQDGCIVPWAGAKEKSFAILGNAGGGDVDVQRFGRPCLAV
jgi:hypothetical protein